MPDHIGNSVQDLVASSDAPLIAEILGKLQDIDANRISKNDDIVMRKAVLALLTIVSNLEGRIALLEGALTAP